jgi:hypothetical protein
MKPLRILASIAMLAILPCLRATALEATGALGDLHYAIYGPDWTWQKRDINIMVLLDNTGSAPAIGMLRIALPETEPLPFVTEQPLVQPFEVPPGGTLRLAFTQIQATDQAKRGVYDLAIGLGTYGNVEQIPYRVRTIRGAAVSPGKWALLLPVLLTALWGAVMFVAMRRMAAPRAWATPGPAFQPDGEAP